MNRKEFYKYYKDYIANVNINNIEFRSFTYDELLVFLKENYYDEEFDKQVCWEPNGITCPFGMYYLDFITCSDESSYMLGLVDNSKGTKTIVFCMIYDKEFGPRNEKDTNVGYISFIETNYFFRRKGVLKVAFKYIKEIFKNSDVLVVSPESLKGSEISIFKRISLLFEGMTEVVSEDDYFSSLAKRQKW